MEHKNLIKKYYEDRIRNSFKTFPNLIDMNYDDDKFEFDFIYIHAKDIIFPFSDGIKAKNKKIKDIFSQDVYDTLKSYGFSASDTVVSPEETFMKSFIHDSYYFYLDALFQSEKPAINDSNEKKEKQGVRCYLTVTFKNTFDIFMEENSILKKYEEEKDLKEFLEKRGELELNFKLLNDNLKNIKKLIEVFEKIQKNIFAFRINFKDHVEDKHKITKEECYDYFMNIISDVFDAEGKNELNGFHKNEKPYKAYNILTAGDVESTPEVIQIPFIVRNKKMELITAYPISKDPVEDYKRLHALFVRNILVKENLQKYPRQVKRIKDNFKGLSNFL